MRRQAFFASLVVIVNVLCICTSALAQGNPASKLPPDPWPRLNESAQQMEGSDDMPRNRGVNWMRTGARMTEGGFSRSIIGQIGNDFAIGRK
jgi:hypothetical protein